MTGITQVLATMRDQAIDQRDLGDRFERLVQQVLTTSPVYTQRFDAVWLWSEWPDRGTLPDTGIDLVARQRDGGGLTAIQAKCYADDRLIARSEIDSFLTASSKEGFTERIIASTVGWGKNAEEAIHGLQVPVTRLDAYTFDDLGVDISAFASTGEVRQSTRKELRAHQREALEAVRAGLTGEDGHDRGQLIMACGTGKTFTALQIVLDQVDPGGSVLFCVPSISLLSQTLTEWMGQAGEQLRPFAVCSDVAVGRRNRDEDMSSVDLTEPATTSGEKLAERMARSAEVVADKVTVIFTTYQSLQAVRAAQVDHGLDAFDLVICDEAHRTTGVTLAGDDESAFVRIHDPAYITAAKRLYMTATPRLYGEESKKKAVDGAAVIASMDDESVFGPVLHRLGFGEAVERDLLADYKVLILAVDEGTVSARFQAQLANDDSELGLDDTARLVGCWNALNDYDLRRAVGFAGNIKTSLASAALLESVAKQCKVDLEDDHPDQTGASVEAAHVDGTFNVLERNRLLAWLKADQNADEKTCRVLTNAKCLSEGVDVPALDAVLFLNPRKSVVDVVQSVGRVMRKSPGKDFGYIVLPIGIPAGVPPEQALADNKRYAVVWEVLRALRAHDDRFNATINKLDLNKQPPENIIARTVPGDAGDEEGSAGDTDTQLELPLSWSDDLRTAIYARMVQKVGERTYWEDWAADIADIAGRHATRIRTLLDDPDLDVAGFFDTFLTGLRANLNEGITRENAIEMLAQHIITKPVFDALFEGYDFTAHNPVSLVMQDMLEVLDEQGIDKETSSLNDFYASVAARARGIDNAEGKQRIITELYEKFFANAFPKAAQSLGIVYTPVEIVDFILRSVDHLLRTELDTSLNDPGVHVLDPFTGTGTFIVRLLQSGLISAENLLHKYTHELHANEINLLAYYVAAVNIEATFHGLHDPDSTTYTPFEGIVLADTFQIHEDDDTLDPEIFVKNNERVLTQLRTPIRVIVGNPPYSAGQDSANDDNANQKYPTLDARVEATYAKKSTVRSKRTLYDSYIRAIRWASDRVGDRGIIGFVSNGGYLADNSADGLRKTLATEFDSIYVYNLRGNAHGAGETRKREGGGVFGGGSRVPIAVVFLVKGGVGTGLHYRDIGDYLTREDKLATVDSATIDTLDWQAITPNDHGDWINQRNDEFGAFDPMGDKSGAAAIFDVYSLGLATGRDAWAYNFSKDRLASNVSAMLANYNAVVDAVEAGHEPDRDAKRISWNRNLDSDLAKRRKHVFHQEGLRLSTYRPFARTNSYFASSMNAMQYRLKAAFPTPTTENLGIVVMGPREVAEPAALMVSAMPDLAVFTYGVQFFPRWRYEPVEDGAFELGEEEPIDGFRRIDNITDSTLGTYRTAFGNAVSKDDIFHYIYGLLHSPSYRDNYAADLKRMLPRIPLVATREDFEAFTNAGRQLADLHLGYGDVEPYPLEEHVLTEFSDPYAQYAVSKMRHGGRGREKDLSTIVYNRRITLSGIPHDAYRYQLGSRSAIDWIIDRYQIREDKPSGIVNDPNDWSREHEQPRYIIDLLKRIVTVSIETMKIVDNLPHLSPRPTK